jgi:hypothetical protein
MDREKHIKIVKMYYKIFSIVVYFGSLALATFLFYDLPAIIYFPMLIILALIWYVIFVKNSFWKKLL